MTEMLDDWMEAEFVDQVLGQHPAPVSPVTREKMWESGLRLHGNQRAFVVEPVRFKKGDGGIRGGKSFGPAVAVYLDFIWRFKVRGVPNDLWGFVADTYSQCTEEMRHLDRLLTEGGIPHRFRTPKNQAWSITFPFCAAEVVTLTATDTTKIAGRPYRAMVMCEAGQLENREAFDQCQLRVSETRGWVMMSGTFENQKGPWYAQMTYDWLQPGALGRVYTMPSWENPLVYPGGRTDPEILAREAAMVPDLFHEKFGAVPRRPSNVVFPQAQREYQVKRRFPLQGTSFDKSAPVMLFIDPGFGHANAVFAVQAVEDRVVAGVEMSPWDRDLRRFAGQERPPQREAQTLWCIDSVYRWGREVKQVVDECVSQPWADKVEDIVLDVASRQHNQNGEPVIEQWAKFWRQETGNRVNVHAQRVPLIPGYDLHRRLLLNTWPEDKAQMEFNPDGKSKVVTDPGGPKIYFDPEAAAPLFGGTVDGTRYSGEYVLHAYQKDGTGMVTRDEPIDRNNDAIKAINYGAWWWFKAGRQGHIQRVGPQVQEFAVVRG